MPRVDDPDARDFLRERKNRQAAQTAENAAARLLAALEQGNGALLDLPSSRDALRRHDDTLRRNGGVPRLQHAYDRFCNAVPAKASDRFSALAAVWGPLLSVRAQP